MVYVWVYMPWYMFDDQRTTLWNQFVACIFRQQAHLPTEPFHRAPLFYFFLPLERSSVFRFLKWCTSVIFFQKAFRTNIFCPALYVWDLLMLLPIALYLLNNTPLWNSAWLSSFFLLLIEMWIIFQFGVLKIMLQNQPCSCLCLSTNIHFFSVYSQ